MDFEWEKLVNGKSEIDADNLNTLADGITENEKEIKAIKDIMDNGGTIPEYLTDFFKEIPEGMSIEDLCGDAYLGYYLCPTQSVNKPMPQNRTFDILVVSDGYYVDKYESMRVYGYFQTRFVWDGFKYRIQTRRGENAYSWYEWEDVFATPQYVKEQIAQISTGGGGEQVPTYLTEYFKELPEDADIDMLLDEGKYIVNKRINNAEYIETITVRWGVNKYEDIDSEYQTIYQVKECFGSNGYQMLIRDRVSDYQWSEWQDCFRTDGGGATFFEYATPQIDITLEEDTTSLDITTIGGKLLSEFNYTAVKILIENAVLPEKGANGGLNLYINSDYGSRYRVSLPGFPTTFLTNNTKQYWSGYCNFAEGIIFGLASATGNAAWGANMQTLADSSPLHEYRKVERVYLLAATTTVPMPNGTRIKIWFK